jgi:hypothetical protein
VVWTGLLCFKLWTGGGGEGALVNAAMKYKTLNSCTTVSFARRAHLRAVMLQ